MLVLPGYEIKEKIAKRQAELFLSPRRALKLRLYLLTTGI